jgi:hypothetical protein
MEQMNPSALPNGHGTALPPAPRPGQFNIDRWQVLQLIKDTAHKTGIGEREIAVLAAHLTVLPKGPVANSDLIFSHMEIGALLERANCMDERRFRRGEARLVALGFVRRKLSANGRRFPVRNAQGQIVDAYGIDLRPSFLRLEELTALRNVAQAEAQFRRALTTKITAQLSALKRWSAAHLGAIPEKLEELAFRLRNIFRRKSTGLEEIVAAEAEVSALTAALASDREEVALAVDPATQDETPAVLPDKIAAEPGQFVRHKEYPRKEYKKESGVKAAPSHLPTVPIDRTQLEKAWQTCPQVASCL